MILLDTSGVLAWIDASQQRHQATRRAMEQEQGPFLLSPFVLAELDYLLSGRVGASAQFAFLGEVARGAYQLETFEPTDIAQAIEILNANHDLDIDLADASLLVLAKRRRCNRLLTLDERHFRVLAGPRGEPFRLLPADS